MKKSLLALVVAAVVAAPVAEGMFFGKTLTLAPNVTWKLDVAPSSGNGSGTAVTVLEVRGAVLEVLDSLTVASGASVSRSYKTAAKGVSRIIIMFDQPNTASMTMVKIARDDPSATFATSTKVEMPVLGDHSQWVIDVAP